MAINYGLLQFQEEMKDHLNDRSMDPTDLEHGCCNLLCLHLQKVILSPAMQEYVSNFLKMMKHPSSSTSKQSPRRAKKRWTWTTTMPWAS